MSKRKRAPGGRRVRPLGDAALLVELGSRVNTAVNYRAHSLALALRKRRDVREAVAGYASVTVHYDPEQVTFRGISTVVNRLLEEKRPLAWSGRLHRVPVAYEGPDLDSVCERLELGLHDLVRLHTAPIYRVFMIGFVPGFAYLGPLSPRLQLPRLPSPRERVEAGSVGIAGEQTGIYPMDTPGGWNLIGKANLRLFLPEVDPPVLLRPGDRVKLFAV